MKTFEVTVGNRVYEVDAPNEATAWQWANQTHSQSMPQQKPVDPTEGMGFGEKALAGAGKAFIDMYRGTKQMLGVNNQEEIDEAKRLDAPLMKTGAGLAGNIVGNVAAGIPAAMIPGANTIGGGALIGAGMSALQPVSGDDSRAYNMAAGGAMGAVLPAIGAAYKSVKAGMIDPVVNRDKIIASALRRGIGDDSVQDAIRALENAAPEATPGVRLSAGDRSMVPGIAAIEDTLRAKNAGGALSRQANTNREVMINALRGIAQDEYALQAAKEAREAATEPLYSAAKNQFIEPTDRLKELMSRPSAIRALREAKVLAADEGVPINFGTKDDPIYSMQSMHYMKRALDNMVSSKGQRPLGPEQKRAVEGLRKSILNELDELSPEYREARQLYSEMSRPINQMQIGQRVYNEFVPSTTGEIARSNIDVVPPSVKASTLASALRNEDQLARLATGFGSAKMQEVLDPQQYQAIRNVSLDASRMADAQKLGAGFGSPTARRIDQSNLLGEYFAENSPITTGILQLFENAPVIGSAVRGVESAGGFVGSLIGSRVNPILLNRLDDMLANNPQQVARLLSEELARLTPAQRNAVLQALPQSVMMALPRVDTGQ